MEENSSSEGTDVIYAKLLQNLEAGKFLENALLAKGEDAMDMFFLDPEGDWIDALPSKKERFFDKLLRRFAPFLKLGS
jgi:hypothetical protein